MSEVEYYEAPGPRPDPWQEPTVPPGFVHWLRALDIAGTALFGTAWLRVERRSRAEKIRAKRRDRRQEEALTLIEEDVDPSEYSSPMEALAVSEQQIIEDRVAQEMAQEIAEFERTITAMEALRRALWSGDVTAIVWDRGTGKQPMIASHYWGSDARSATNHERPIDIAPEYLANWSGGPLHKVYVYVNLQMLVDALTTDGGVRSASPVTNAVSQKTPAPAPAIMSDPRKRPRAGYMKPLPAWIAETRDMAWFKKNSFADLWGKYKAWLRGQDLPAYEKCHSMERSTPFEEAVSRARDGR